VGDTAQSDIAGARASGLRSIWMSRGRTWVHGDFAPDAIASDVPDAVELVLRMTDAL
jgi:putative hydrolase of the HAD superfamily